MKTLYIDMDNVLVDFGSGIDQLCEKTKAEFHERYDEVPGIFATMKPFPEALESYRLLCRHFDTYILSSTPWNNPGAAADKIGWVRRYLGDVAEKRLILSHHKNLCAGDFLVDDRTKNGAENFCGKHIHFATPEFPDWKSVVEYLMERK